MHTFESAPVIEPDNGNEQEIKRETDPNLKELWKKYHFMGEPPFKDSPATQRLYDTCKRYLQYALDNKPLSPTYKRDETEDYFAQFRRKEVRPISESSRRELHNQIAIMVLGKQRSEMEQDQADIIADFASELIYGMPIAEAIENRKENR